MIMSWITIIYMHAYKCDIPIEFQHSKNIYTSSYIHFSLMVWVFHIL